MGHGVNDGLPEKKNLSQDLGGDKSELGKLLQYVGDVLGIVPANSNTFWQTALLFAGLFRISVYFTIKTNNHHSELLNLKETH